jgi:hypothetical protein
MQYFSLDMPNGMTERLLSWKEYCGMGLYSSKIINCKKLSIFIKICLCTGIIKIIFPQYS